MVGDKKESGKKPPDDTGGDGGGAGEEAKLKLVESFINTPEEQLSSMTSLQPNLVVPLAMMEMYDKLFEILAEDIERYAEWLGLHKKYMEEHKKDERKVDEEVWVEAPSEEQVVPERRRGIRALLSRGRKRQPKTPVMVKEIQEIGRRLITWGPEPTAEELEEAELRVTLTDTLLTRAFRLSLYKHRRSVGGMHRMATVDLAKEEMAMQGSEEEKGLPDWEE